MLDDYGVVRGVDNGVDGGIRGACMSDLVAGAAIIVPDGQVRDTLRFLDRELVRLINKTTSLLYNCTEQHIIMV